MLKLLLVVALFAVITYLTVRVIERRGQPAARRGHPAQGVRRRPARPAAPDDDEEFLRELDRRRLDPGDDEGR